MENEIYIGKNGIGKSEKLKEILEKNKGKSLFLKYTEKTNAPDSNIIDKNNELLKNFEEFLSSIFTFKSSIKLDEMPETEKEKYNSLSKDVLEDSDLDKMWNEMLKDKNLKFLSDKKIGKIIKSNKNNQSFEIISKMYLLDFQDWKTTTSKGIKTYGTGNLAYFQIKFIYSYLNLIQPNENKYLIIDEPELFLHTSLKRKVGYMLKEIGKKINVIVSSHSSSFLSSFYDYNNTEVFSKKDYSNDWKKIKLKNPHVITSLREYFESLMADKFFIVEGNNDYKLIEYVLNNKFYESNAHIIISSGKDKLLSKFNILNSVKDEDDNPLFSKDDIFIIFDKDNSKKDEKASEWAIHKDLNEKIENEKKIKFKKPFDENLEAYFDIEDKTNWDIDDFFKKNPSKLDSFIEGFKIDSFLNPKSKN